MVANKGSTIINGNANSGHMITLNIHVPRDKIVQPMQFDVQMLIGDICRSIQGHLPITIDHDRKKEKKKQTILFFVEKIFEIIFIFRSRIWTFYKRWTTFIEKLLA